jgi:hypothetical protein
MKKKYLKFYKECMKSGRMPDAGLCFVFGNDDLFNSMFAYQMECFYWGYNGTDKYNRNKVAFTFTPMRQTIVLFLAAMNNEL